MRLPAFTKQHKCSREATCTGDYGTEVAAHAPEDCLKGKSLGFPVERLEFRGGPEKETNVPRQRVLKEVVVLIKLKI